MEIIKKPVQMRSSNYGIYEQIRNLFTFVRNRIDVPSARLIRYPVILRGEKYIDFGKNLTTGYNCRIEVNGEHDGKVLFFGENVNIGDNVSIRCADKICIGNNVLMGSSVLIIDNSHGNYSGDNQDDPELPSNQRQLYVAPIVIEDNVWIGEGAVIQAGVTVGRGSIVAANSVVANDIPSGHIVSGVPARLIKKYDKIQQKWKNL